MLQSARCRPSSPLQLFCFLKIANDRQATAEMIKRGCLHDYSLCTTIYHKLDLLFQQIRKIRPSISFEPPSVQ